MGKATGFLEIERLTPAKRPVTERVNDWLEVYQPWSTQEAADQGARCMDCGVPFCHTGCPLGNMIPDWNDLVYQGRWKEAIRQLHATNNFPEFTGRLCPAPCEAACVLGINAPAVTIKGIENAIIDQAWANGWVQPEPPSTRTGKLVAVIGSGPAGLAAAQQLNRMGHTVTVFEKSDRLGGLLRYGIPDFKMEKHLIDRRIQLMEVEGVEFETNAHVGGNIKIDDLKRRYDAILLCCGAEWPRNVELPGRELKGIHFAMDFLTQQNKSNHGDRLEEQISATGKQVVIIGGGDTGADCLGTSHRQKAAKISQLQIHAAPPETRHDSTPWPLWPLQYRSETSHEEGGNREWSILTKEFVGNADGQVTGVRCVRVGPGPKFEPVPNSEFVIDADLVLIAIGFRGVVKGSPQDLLGLKHDSFGRVETNEDYLAHEDGIFVAGDLRRGQSLIVWAIAEGRKAADGMDRWLKRA
jgi:glutamate synthase (NADPH) small chain